MTYNIVIQGPLNATSLDHIEDYKQLGKVVVSHWATDNQELLDKLHSHSDIQIICKPEPQENLAANLGRAYEPSTFFKAITSQYFAFQSCTQTHTIKTRSDEYYSLRPVIEMMNKEPTKLFFGNVFYNPVHLFHIGDHLYGGETPVLKEALTKIYNYYYDVEADEFCEQCLKEKAVGSCPEHVLCKALMYAKGIRVHSINKVHQIRSFIENNFMVVDVNLLQPFLARHNTANRTYDNVFNDKRLVTSIKQVLNRKGRLK